ncbi:hypothetical protein CAPTEDRAFT_217379 [Capitella teleta]|uniref:LRRCT domain-containing protein n=1 Tax=Capitella teleta TaxID=283909 RepID=R7T9H0_CAPTE|nr:hypothetical protein CAPTEDRAFT_217379 [Capitella teleta]|eukprot:ELT90383.1 hypothetical protein CAPTEDRAFT_217379 [Capitella teleta]
MEIFRLVTMLVCLFETTLGGLEQIFDDQGLTSIPLNISGNVTDLSCEKNAINTIRTVDFNDKYPHLSSILLAENVITLIEDGSFKGTKLSRIRLRKNDISVIPDFSEVKSTLTTIDLAVNKITELSVGDLSYLTQLTTLNLLSNRIISVADGCFAGTNLGHVILDKNLLTNIPDFLAVNATLRTLDIQSNELVDVSPGEVSYLGKLENFYLKGNRISLLPDLAKYLPSLTKLMINELPLQCCCGMAWMKELSESFSVEMDTRPCVSPSKWNESTWDEITGEMLRREPCEIDASHWIRCQVTSDIIMASRVKEHVEANSDYLNEQENMSITGAFRVDKCPSAYVVLSAKEYDHRV